MSETVLHPQVDIATPRLRLRGLKPRDAALIALHASDARVANMTAVIPHPYPPGLAESFVERARAPGARDRVWALDAGEEVPVDSLPVAIGRGGQNEIPLDGDEFASAQHARFESRRDGLWVEDIGSTNGTFVNGARVTTPRRLTKGDVVRVGQTDFRVEV